jgi:hypothetical protein
VETDESNTAFFRPEVFDFLRQLKRHKKTGLVRQEQATV